MLSARVLSKVIHDKITSEDEAIKDGNPGRWFQRNMQRCVAKLHNKI